MFKPNPHFEDTKLTKTFRFLEEGVTKITATNIKWKEGMVSFTQWLFEVIMFLYSVLKIPYAYLDSEGHA